MAATVIHRRRVLAAAAIAALLCGASAALLVLSWDAPIGEGSWGVRGFGLVNAVGFTVIGLIVALRSPNPIGRLLLLAGLLWALTEAELEYAAFAVAGRPSALPGGIFAAWLCSWQWTVVVGLYPVVFVLFPDGDLRRPGRRPIIAGAGVVTVLLAVQMAFRPGPLQLAAFVDDPFVPLPQPIIDAIGTVAIALTFPLTGWAATTLIARFRRATGVERQQLKWLAFAALPVVLVGPLSAIVPGKPVQLAGAFLQLAVPAAIGVAVLRYRLYDIDILINRTMVYGATTAGVAVVFVAGIAVLEVVLRPLVSGSEIAVAISTLAAVALVQPLHRRVQAFVDRRFYRARYDSERIVEAFADRLRDEVDLDDVSSQLLAAVHATVQPRGAGLWLRQ